MEEESCTAFLKNPVFGITLLYKNCSHFLLLESAAKFLSTFHSFNPGVDDGQVTAACAPPDHDEECGPELDCSSPAHLPEMDTPSECVVSGAVRLARYTPSRKTCCSLCSVVEHRVSLI